MDIAEKCFYYDKLNEILEHGFDKNKSAEELLNAVDELVKKRNNYCYFSHWDVIIKDEIEYQLEDNKDFFDENYSEYLSYASAEELKELKDEVFQMCEHNDYLFQQFSDTIRYRIEDALEERIKEMEVKQ